MDVERSCPKRHGDLAQFLNFSGFFRDVHWFEKTLLELRSSRMDVFALFNRAACISPVVPLIVADLIPCVNGNLILELPRRCAGPGTTVSVLPPSQDPIRKRFVIHRYLRRTGF